MFVSVKTKILTIVILVAFLTAAVLVSIVLVKKEGLRNNIDEELMLLAEGEVTKIAKDVWLMCRAMDDQISLEVDSSLKVAKAAMDKYGTPRIGSQTVVVKGTSLPAFYLGDRLVEPNTDPNTYTPVVDEVQEQLGAPCSIFQRINPAGDMLRIATNMTADGQRQIGTMIMATGTDGTQSPVIRQLLAGQTYRGTNMVIGKLMTAAYEPIKDPQGNLIGAIATAVEVEKVTSLRDGIRDIVVGQNGYAFVLGGEGDDRAHYIIGNTEEDDGKDLSEAKDTNGNLFVQEIVDLGMTTSAGASEIHRYEYEHPKTKQPEPKLTAVTYFEPWDWVIGAGTYESDYQNALGRVNAAIMGMVWLVVVFGLVILVVAVVVAWTQAARIANPLIRAAGFAGKVADGDLTQRIDLKQNDEVGQLVTALNTMSEMLHGVVMNIATAANDMAASSEELSASSDETSKSIQQVAATIQEVARGSQDTTTNVGQARENLMQSAQAIEGIAKEIEEVAAYSTQASSQGEEGGKAADGAARIITNAARSVQETTVVVQALGEKTAQIGEFIGIITGIADQTNLLALNAAIEAARAGEAGRGFAVVAEEVRKLAEESNEAAGNITHLVKGIEGEMQTALEAMDRSDKEVGEGAETVKQASAMLAEIVEGIRTVTEKVQNISAAAEEINASTAEVVDGMQSVAAVAEENAAASEEVSSATEEQTAAMEEVGSSAATLAKLAQDLQELVARFKV